MTRLGKNGTEELNKEIGFQELLAIHSSDRGKRYVPMNDNVTQPGVGVVNKSFNLSSCCTVDA